MRGKIDSRVIFWRFKLRIFTNEFLYVVEWDYLRCGRVEEGYTGWMIIGSCGYFRYGCNVTLDYESIFEFLGVKLDFNVKDDKLQVKWIELISRSNNVNLSKGYF